MTKREKDDEVPEKTGISIGVGDGALTLSYEEAAHLATLAEHPGYKGLRAILKAMLDSTTVTLRDRTKSIEDIRFHQGYAEAASRIADALEKELPEWYKSGSREGSGEDHA